MMNQQLTKPKIFTQIAYPTLPLTLDLSLPDLIAQRRLAQIATQQ
jgi:hypothetical protein